MVVRRQPEDTARTHGAGEPSCVRQVDDPQLGRLGSGHRGGWLKGRPGRIHMALRFHWMLPKGGEVGMKSAQATSRVLTTERSSPCGRPDMNGCLQFARCAEQAGIESVLLSFSRYEPDTLLIACALGRATKKLKFIVAYRSGLIQPTTFVQQLNTLSGLIDGRVAVNIVA